MAQQLSTRDLKLIQYLNEAYGKERELETSLQAHIAMTTRAPYKKRLQEHLRETKAQAKGLERRIKALGGKAEVASVPGPDAASEALGAVTSAANKAMAAAKGPLHALRGTGEAEKQLKNAKTELSEEAEEIANYTAIEALAEAVNDKETAKLARDFRRQEERMASFLERLIPQLTRAVAQEEIPAAERRKNGAARRRSTRSRSAATSARGGSRTTASSGSGARKTASSRGTPKSGARKRTTAGRSR